MPAGAEAALHAACVVVGFVLCRSAAAGHHGERVEGRDRARCSTAFGRVQL